jgi:PAS domain S-box-containing protein
MSFLHRISLYGVSLAGSESEKRNITLTNYISLIVATTPVLLIIADLSHVDVEFYRVARLLVGSFVFLLPVLANRFGYINLSRILLCWLPGLFIFALGILDAKLDYPKNSASSLVGIRMFLLPFASFPFLIFNLRGWKFLIIGLLGPLLYLIFFDPVLKSFGAEYTRWYAFDPLYAFNNVRALVSFLIIALSCFLLKRMVERNESVNEKLASELAEKNTFIQQQAEDEVHQLNRRLSANLQRLQEREFILNQSQRIAKMGSWEYSIEGAFLFWSDELYNIFALDKDFQFKVENLSLVFLDEDCKVLINATDVLLRTGESYDLTVRARTPFGNSKWVRVTAFPVTKGEKIVGARGIAHDITYFKEAEDLRRVSQNRYRSLFEQASDFIMILDFNGNFLDVNRSFCEAFGYSKEELVDLKIEDLIEPDQIKARPIVYREIRRGDHVLSDRLMMRKDKTIIEVEANVRKLDASQMLVIARDVTKLREAQRRTALSEATFRGAFEYSAIGMALVSREKVWMRVNKELSYILGYSEEELLQMTVTDVTHPDDREQDDEMILQVLANKIETFQREKRYIHKNGNIIWATLNVSAVKDKDDQPLFFVSQIEDITSKKQAEELLQLSQANLTATINNTTVLIWSIDMSFRLLMFNNPFSVYVKKNYGVDAALGLPIFDENTDLGRSTYEKWSAYLRRLENGKSFSFEEERFGIDFHYSLSPIMEGDKIIGATVFADDVTERKLRDRQLAEANKKIGEFKLMALRSVMSPHFIFNVLNSIQFYIAKSDRFNAIVYLSAFSKLIRTILTHSVDNRIKLMDEIEMLRNYVILEATRFENKFNFKLEVDPGIELGSVQIPSLLVQPYVENAILHGLYNKKEAGNLIIRVKEMDESILFEIEDNGIGRAAAQKLRQQNFPEHKSMGIRITEERLKLINQQNHTAFEVEDLVDDQGAPCGTRVHIRISIEEG